jgi:hypothetical protein
MLNFKKINVFKNICIQNKFNFSTLLVPEIINGNQIHSSVNVLASAASQLDQDVNI